MRVKKKPVEVEAVHFTRDNIEELKEFAGDMIEIRIPKCIGGIAEAMITTLEGTMHATEGDWIIKGVNGEFYSCKENIFDKTYDIITEQTPENEISW